MGISHPIPCVLRRDVQELALSTFFFTDFTRRLSHAFSRQQTMAYAVTLSATRSRSSCFAALQAASIT